MDCFAAKLREIELSESTVSLYVRTVKAALSHFAEKVTNVRSFIREMIAFGYRCYLPGSPKFPHDYVPKVFSDEGVLLDKPFRWLPLPFI